MVSTNPRISFALHHTRTTSAQRGRFEHGEHRLRFASRRCDNLSICYGLLALICAQIRTFPLQHGHHILHQAHATLKTIVRPYISCSLVSASRSICRRSLRAVVQNSQASARQRICYTYSCIARGFTTIVIIVSRTVTLQPTHKLNLGRWLPQCKPL